MKIVILDGWTANPGDLDWSPLESLGELTVYPRTSPYELIERAREAQILLTNKVALGKDVLDILTRLKYIGVLATGYSLVDTQYCKQLGIGVTNIPGYSTDSVAQHVFALILHHTNRIATHHESVASGQWSKQADFSYTLSQLSELRNKTLGIVGFGDIGSQVARIALAFGMKVIVSKKLDGSMPRKFLESNLSTELEVADWNQFPELCDFVSLHCPHTPETENMVNQGWLQKITRNPLYLINTARGQLVDDHALVAALDSGLLSGYWADVLRREPPEPTNPLIGHKNTIITPHLSWSSREARVRLIKIAADNINAYLQDKSLNRIV